MYMAEIAFETVVRMVIAIMTLSLIIALMTFLEQKGEGMVTEIGSSERIVDGSGLSIDAYKALMTACYEENKNYVGKEKVCFLVRNVDKELMAEAASQLEYVRVERISSNVLITFTQNGDVVLN